MKKLYTKHKVEILVDDHVFEWAQNMSWCINGKGYVLTNVRDGDRFRTKMLSRMVMGARAGDPMVDHKSGTKTDNQRSNLRFATRAQNVVNSVEKRSGKVHSVHKGVTKRKNKWEARLGRQGKYLYLGLYDSETQAAEAVRAKSIEIDGEFSVFART